MDQRIQRTFLKGHKQTGFMRRIRLQKIGDDTHGQEVTVERAYEGWEEQTPASGRPYTLLLDNGRVLKTSNVVKMLEGYLVTENSLYKFSIVDTKPFDLGKQSLTETRELVYPKEPSVKESGDRLAHLSSREREIFQLLAEGLSVKEAGEILHISPKTVETYKGRIMEKLGIHSMSQWIKEAIRAGIIDVGS
jgi:DNA-binding CsgD family transcriptional regulator